MEAVSVRYADAASEIFRYVVDAVVVERNIDDDALGIYASEVEAERVR